MSLTTATALKTLDTAFGGQPFCSIPAKSGITLTNLDVAFGGQPFYAPAIVAGGGPGGSANQTYIINS